MAINGRKITELEQNIDLGDDDKGYVVTASGVSKYFKFSTLRLFL